MGLKLGQVRTHDVPIYNEGQKTNRIRRQATDGHTSRFNNTPESIHLCKY